MSARGYSGLPRNAYKQSAQTAKAALDGASDNQRITFALALILDVKDPNEAARLRFAANRIAESSDILIREAYGCVRLTAKPTSPAS